MPIIRIRVENPDELLHTSFLGAGALGRVERSAVGGGAGYSELGTFAIVTAVTAYTYYDLPGAVSSWYRIRYSKSDATSPSPYGDEFQSGAASIVELYDVKQRLGISATDATKDEILLEFIGRVSAGIQGYTGRRFARDPASGTKTYLFDVTRQTRTLWVPQGIAEMSQLEVATETGGAFTVVPAGDWYLDPPETERDIGWPATRVTLSDNPTGTTTTFYIGKRVVRTTMAEGWASVPGDVQGIAEDEVIRRYQGRGQGYTSAESGEGFIRLLRANAPDDARRLGWYRNIQMV